ncbi:hypothetical protein ACHQM5_002447 [Ranunculus cassubicifolius]
MAEYGVFPTQVSSPSITPDSASEVEGKKMECGVLANVTHGVMPDMWGAMWNAKNESAVSAMMSDFLLRSSVAEPQMSH